MDKQNDGRDVILEDRCDPFIASIRNLHRVYNQKKLS